MPAWTQPRVAPPTLLPAAAGAIVIAVALPIFLLAGWRVAGWGLGAVLWGGSEALGWVLTRLQSRTGNLAAAGVVAFGMLFRAIAVMVVVFAVAVSDKWLGLAAALTYAAGYSAALGLQLVAYYTGPVAGGRRRNEARTRRTRHDRAAPAGERIRARRVRSDDGVRAARVDPDPPRPAEHVDHEGGRLPDARERADDPLRDRVHAHAHRPEGRAQGDVRRDGLRDRADPGGRAGPPAQGDQPLVPVRGDADAVHLRRQLPRLHPAAADRRDQVLRARSHSGASTPRPARSR